MFNSVSFKVSLFGTEKINMRVEQGYEMKWSSLIHIRAEEKECKNNVRLGKCRKYCRWEMECKIRGIKNATKTIYCKVEEEKRNCFQTRKKNGVIYSI